MDNKYSMILEAFQQRKYPSLLGFLKNADCLGLDFNYMRS